MPVFTILNHGTNSHRSRTDGEIIADFGRNVAGTEYKDFLITDGPGSKGTAKAPMPGTFDPFTKDKVAKKKTEEWSKTPTRTLANISGKEQRFFEPAGHGVLKAIVPEKQHAGITGEGWDDNIRHVIATLAELPSSSGTINMIGWSRGAVTCLRMANWIREFLGPGFEINIFAIDPVAGLDAGVELKDTAVIPRTVRNYVAILALDEMRGDFAPQDLSRIKIEDPTETNVAFLPFPGVHNTPVIEKDAKLAEVTKVVRHLGYKFLTKHGTAFKKAETTFTASQLCELYAAMQQKREGYRAMMKKDVEARLSGGIVERGVRQHAASYVHADAKFFINEHHRECMKRAAPDVYNYFFTKGVPNPLNKATTSYRASDPWGQRFQQFFQSLPESFKVLSNVYLVEREGGVASPAVWRVSAPGVGAGNIPAPPLTTGAVQSLL